MVLLLLDVISHDCVEGGGLCCNLWPCGLALPLEMSRMAVSYILPLGADPNLYAAPPAGKGWSCFVCGAPGEAGNGAREHPCLGI